MFDSTRIDPTALSQWRSRPREALKCYLFAGLLSFYPHEYNADTRKLVTVLVFVTWAVIEVLAVAGVGSAPGLMVYLRPAVFLILGQMWGIEIVNMQAFGDTQATQSEDDS
ncbi:hypothetical protein [Halorussus marinus]|uniref:hypothetical protein n=1 Tax=Halorussus marinus TaxID=2505976 RepID=UPI00106DE0B7|nr:hypothetical protein [Halorussus marinus]